MVLQANSGKTKFFTINMRIQLVKTQKHAFFVYFAKSFCLDMNKKVCFFVYFAKNPGKKPNPLSFINAHEEVIKLEKIRTFFTGKRIP